MSAGAIPAHAAAMSSKVWPVKCARFSSRAGIKIDSGWWDRDLIAEPKRSLRVSEPWLAIIATTHPREE